MRLYPPTKCARPVTHEKSGVAIQLRRPIVCGSFDLVKVVLFALVLFSCSAAPKPCARYGTLDAEYLAAIQHACGPLNDLECETERPDALEDVRSRYRPQFQEAERCQAE